VRVDLESLPIGEEAPGVVNAVIEVPVGSRNKYEYEPELGTVVRDRVLPANVRFPADYGFVPSTVGADGEPLDIMVAAYDPVFPGCVLKARVIGALEMNEGGGREYTIYAVPDNDPRFEDIGALDDMPQQNLREIEQFFTAFKRLEGDEEARVRGWHGLEEARKIVRESAR
jgi:inorganic pyrophosphatase